MVARCLSDISAEPKVAVYFVLAVRVLRRTLDAGMVFHDGRFPLQTDYWPFLLAAQSTSTTKGGLEMPANFADYETKTAEERLRLLQEHWEAATDQEGRAFFEGRMLEATIGLDDHPEWYGHGCLCHECLTCG
jgi:hypothetical protein